MTIRVLQVVTTMDIGGLETFIMNIYRNIDRTKVQFDFLKHRETDSFFDEEIRQMGGRIYNVPSIHPFHHNKYLNSLDSFLKMNNEYKIVHSHINTYSMYALRAAEKANIPVRIAHSHATTPTKILDSKLIFRNYTKNKIKDYTTNNFACSIEAGKWLYGEKSYQKNEIEVINNAIETEKFLYNPKTRLKIRKELGLKDEFLIGHIGSFSEPKNHKFIIDIFNELYLRNNNARLLLVGDGGLRSEIEAKVEKLGLKEKIIFTGIQPNANDFLQAMDVFLMPSLYEGLPVTLVEAQASGIQCVISDNITDEVKITNLVDSISLEKSPNYWAEQINKYSTGYHRKDMSKEIINAGYDVKITAKCLEEFYLKEHYKHQKDN